MKINCHIIKENTLREGVEGPCVELYRQYMAMERGEHLDNIERAEREGKNIDPAVWKEIWLKRRQRLIKRLQGDPVLACNWDNLAIWKREAIKSYNRGDSKGTLLLLGKISQLIANMSEFIKESPTYHTNDE